MRVAQQNAAGGKGPCGGRAGGGGKREGMSGHKSRSNHPQGRRPLDKVRQLQRRHRNGVKDVRVLVKDLNPVLRGWGNYFRTGNAAKKFNQVDRYVVARLRSFLVKRKGRNLRPGEAERWTREYFETFGLHRLRGTVKYPERPFWEAA